MWKKSDSKAGGSGEEEKDMANQETMNNGTENDASVIAFVGKGVEFKGVITYDGTVRIDGQLDGEIHTEGTLLVGEEAVISAKISAGTIVSKGKITGDIVAKEKIRLMSPAILNGSAKTPILSMEEGVLFNGNIEMAHAEIHELPRETVMRAVNAPVTNIKRVTG
ncbi:MAG TPA: polymer-forming cytoskeletal protein [Nitrospiraceae bacterium]|jgi:cytoskeletal protein CcmA (bactofilin family)|nr:polymer-forming cytoskeletal protein [Nitrospiraceae bacterium]